MQTVGLSVQSKVCLSSSSSSSSSACPSPSPSTGDPDQPDPGGHLAAIRAGEDDGGRCEPTEADANEEEDSAD